MKLYGVVGYKGKLGSLLVRKPNFVPVDVDITDMESLSKVLCNSPFDVLVNCAGISSIDRCEFDEKLAFRVNVAGIINLHDVFGERVLNVSSDNVFSGKSYFLQSEGGKRDPVNYYGFTKMAAEEISKKAGGKTIRLSRTVSMADSDLNFYLRSLNKFESISVPDFMFRNYLTRAMAVEGIAYFAENFDVTHTIVNYGSLENISMYSLVCRLAESVGYGTDGINKRTEESDSFVPRPLRGGFRMSLAKKLGFPYFTIDDVISELTYEYKNLYSNPTL